MSAREAGATATKAAGRARAQRLIHVKIDRDVHDAMRVFARTRRLRFARIVNDAARAWLARQAEGR